MSESVYAGLTSQTIDVFLGDSSSTTGSGLTGLAYNTSNLTCYYRKGATGSSTAITLATQTVGGAWSSGGFVEVDSTNMKGIYRFDIPNAVVDTEGFATLYFRGATNLVATAIRLDCRPYPVDVKKFGGTNGTFSSGRPEVNATHWGGTAVASANVLIDGAITAAKIASDAITDAKVASDVTIASVTGAVGSVTGAVGSVTGNVGGNVAGSVGSVTAGVTLADGAITAAKIADGAIDAATFAADVDAEILSYLVDDATRIDASAMNTLSSHDPGEAIMGATDLGTGSGLTSLASQASVDTIDGIVDAILADTGTDGVVISATTANAIADALLDRTAGVETNRTLRQALRLILAAAAGKLSGAADTTVTIRDTNDSKDRITATVDADGNRTAVTLDAT